MSENFDSRDMTIKDLQEEIAVLKQNNAILEEQVKIAVDCLKELRTPVESGSVSL